MKSIVVTNRKGGSAKSATAVNLAACAGRTCRTLLIDLDVQGDSSTRLGVRGSGEELADALLGRRPFDEAIRSTEFGVDVAVAGEVLDYISDSVDPRALERCLSSMRRPYDLVIVDCPPSLNDLVLAGWRATIAPQGLVPVDGPEALSAVPRLLTAWADAGRDPTAVRLLMTRWDGRRRMDRLVHKEALRAYGPAVLGTTVRESIVVAESAARRTPLVTYAPRHPVTEDHRALWKEVVHG